MQFKLRIRILNFLYQLWNQQLFACRKFGFEFQLADSIFHERNGRARGASALLGVRKLTCFFFGHGFQLSNENEPKRKFANRYIRLEGPNVRASIRFWIWFRKIDFELNTNDKSQRQSATTISRALYYQESLLARAEWRVDDPVVAVNPSSWRIGDRVELSIEYRNELTRTY